jgi:hypothetical protein
MWRSEHSIEIDVPPVVIWRLFEDVEGWKAWNSGIESIEMHGPFAVGTKFTMKPPGQDAFQTTLVQIIGNELFVDETRLGDVCVRVTHRIARLAPARVRVTYAAEVTGASAEEIGLLVSGDFPDVLRALAALAVAAFGSSR